jgi:hypothetical protein
MRSQEAIVSWFEEGGESAMSLPCAGVFDDCNSVYQFLSDLKNAVTDNEEFLIKYPTDKSERKEGRYIKLNGVDYQQLSVVYTAESNSNYYVKPQHYKDFKGDFFTSDGRIVSEQGFELMYQDKTIARILVNDGANTFKKVESLRKYLFGKLVGLTEDVVETRRIIIQDALEQMEDFLGNDYEQESGSKRTDLTDEGTNKMDCSEFVSRFLQKATGVSKVPAYNTASLVNELDSSDFFRFVEGSQALDFKDISPGDIFLWRTSAGGHTGVVSSYNSVYDLVTVVEAIGSGGANEESLSMALDGYCKDCIRRSVYTRTGKALASHKGWVGYLRPKIK